MSSIAYFALFQTAFGALGIVAMSCITTISGRIEDRLNSSEETKEGSDLLEQAGLPTAGVSYEVKFSVNDRTQLDLLRWIAIRCALVYVIFLGLSVFLLLMHWKGLPIGAQAPLVPALGFTFWLVVEIRAVFRANLDGVVESTAKLSKQARELRGLGE